jgi:hypothetical protein
VLRSRLFALPAAVLLTATLAACGGGSDSPSAEKTSASADKSTPTPTPEVAELTTEDFVARLTAAQDGVTSYDIAMTTTGAAASSATGSVDTADGKQDMAIKMSTAETGDIEVRMVGGMLYLNLAELSGGLFLQVDPNDPSNPFGAAFSTLGEDMSASAGIKNLEAALVSVTATGESEAIDGTDTQVYEVVVDTTKIAPELQTSLGADGAAALPETLTYTYWIDADDLIRQVAFDIAGTTTTTTFSNFGAGAPVEAPPADQITTEMPF